jgi:hypothetical protein
LIPSSVAYTLLCNHVPLNGYLIGAHEYEAHQHPTERIAVFMQASQAASDAMVLGVPVFGAEAPRARVLGRKISNACHCCCGGDGGVE